MKKKLSKFLSIAGSVLAWLPILAPLFFALISLLSDRRFRFDYLMPLELFPVFLVGAGLILWASIRVRKLIKLCSWSLGIAIGSLLTGQLLAVVTGLASGAHEPTGWRGAILVFIIVLPILAMISTGIGGLLLIRHLFKPLPASTTDS